MSGTLFCQVSLLLSAPSSTLLKTPSACFSRLASAAVYSAGLPAAVHYFAQFDAVKAVAAEQAAVLAELLASEHRLGYPVDYPFTSLSAILFLKLAKRRRKTLFWRFSFF